MKRKSKKQKDRMKYFNEGKRTAISEVIEWVAFNLPVMERGMDLKEEIEKTKDTKLKRDLRIRYDEVTIVARMCWKLFEDEKFKKKIARDIIRDYRFEDEILE